MSDQVRASHILLSTDGKEAETVLAVIQDLHTQISDGASFAELAAKHSACPSGSRGGDLGSFGPGMMVPEFDKVSFELEVGELSGPVQTNFGYHLIQRTE